jgi:hypothetical protein
VKPICLVRGEQVLAEQVITSYASIHLIVAGAMAIMRNRVHRWKHK